MQYEIIAGGGGVIAVLGIHSWALKKIWDEVRGLRDSNVAIIKDSQGELLRVHEKIADHKVNVAQTYATSEDITSLKRDLCARLKRIEDKVT